MRKTERSLVFLHKDGAILVYQENLGKKWFRRCFVYHQDAEAYANDNHLKYVRSL